MSVIARKIAHANSSETGRPDAVETIAPFFEDMTKALANWLDVQEVDVELLGAQRALRDVDESAFALTVRGSRRSQRIAIVVTERLAQSAAQTVLGMEYSNDASVLAALRPFVENNLYSLAIEIEKTRITSNLDTLIPEWEIKPTTALSDDFEDLKLISAEIDFIEGAGEKRVTLIMTDGMVLIDANADDELETEKPPRLSPRLGPCHVEVRAVADRVRMSVADCTRLEIGQTIGLPGLRFDQLDLTVEMGDGPVPLTDAALGADKGLKAVRLNRSLDPAFREAPTAPAQNAKPSSAPQSVPA